MRALIIASFTSMLKTMLYLISSRRLPSSLCHNTLFIRAKNLRKFRCIITPPPAIKIVVASGSNTNQVPSKHNHHRSRENMAKLASIATTVLLLVFVATTTISARPLEHAATTLIKSPSSSSPSDTKAMAFCESPDRAYELGQACDNTEGQDNRIYVP